MSSWRESAGRKEGNEGYRFGDLTRTLVKKLIVGGEEAVESKLPSRIARTVKRYGWRPDLPDHRDLKADFSHIFAALPKSVDLRDKCPDLYDQGELGSCTANAIAAAFEFDQRKELIAEFKPSRLFIYYGERKMEGSTDADSGAMIRDGIKVVHKLGCCDEALWPYDVDKFTEEPPQAAYDAAKAHKSVRYYRVAQHERMLKGCLAAGYPFVFGFTVLSSFETQEVADTGVMPMPADGDKQLGGHAVCCVGYDDDKQCFVVRNSWGSSWGDGGYFYMPYKYMTDSGLASDFWTIRWVE